jgi:penicillin-binding protein 1C
MRKILLWLGALFLIAIILRFAPLPPIPRETTPTIVDRNGVVLYEPLSPTGTRSAWTSSIPANVESATIAAEDKRFYFHPGIDPIAIARALAHDLRRARILEGGSTITQQVAKLLLHRTSRWQKLRETIVALQLEARYSKKEILALYLNLAPYGDQTIGIARASQRTFGCDPEQLTVAQAAYLAARPQRPSAKNVRYRAVLARMHATKADFAEKLTFEKGEHPLLAPHFVERVRAGATGPRIETTLDAQLQRAVQGIIAAAKPELLRHGAHSVAVAVLDNRSGDWLAWEGSGDYSGTDFGGAIDGVVTPRQPGSALKPFTYALAFESGFTPATVLDDVPSHFPTAEEGVVYTPRNYDGRYRGPLRARLALAGSENVPAVQLLSKLGPASLLRFLRAFGFRNFDRTADYYGLGLTLGDAEVTVEQLVRAYATFARGGVAIEPSMLLHAPRRERRLVSQRTAFWITDILSDSSAREYIFGSGGALDFPFPVAVKTGTSQAYRDNWTIGYTRDVTVGVWVGNFDLTALRNSSGVTGAGPIFHDVMLAAAKDREQIVDRPSELELVPICALTGLRPSTACPEVDNEWLPSDARVVFCEHPRAGRETRPDQPARTPALRITTPADNATYLIDPTLRREFQALRLRASADANWTVDGKRVKQEWPLQPGRHVIAAVDERGRRDTVTITVR